MTPQDTTFITGNQNKDDYLAKYLGSLGIILGIYLTLIPFKK